MLVGLERLRVVDRSCTHSTLRFQLFTGDLCYFKGNSCQKGFPKGKVCCAVVVSHEK